MVVPDSTVTVLDDGSMLIAGGGTAGGDTLTDAAIVRPTGVVK